MADAATAEGEGEVPPEFECSICMKLLLDPVSVPCGHTFCRTCLEQSLGYRGQCAVCRAPIAGGQSVNVLIRSIIGSRYPKALAERRREFEEELQVGERVAEEARQREVTDAAAMAGAAGAGTAGGDGQRAPILPLLRSSQLFLPHCRAEVELHTEAEVRLIEYALQGARRLAAIDGLGAGFDEMAQPLGVCLQVEGIERTALQPPRVRLLGKFRFRLVEAPQLHEAGFELGRCEAFFDTPLATEELVLHQPADDGGANDGAAPAVARSALDLIEQQLSRIGQAGRHTFTTRFGEVPAVGGSATTSAAMEQVSFWLLGAVVSDDSFRRQWIAAIDTTGRLEACHARLVTAGSRPVLDLPGARSWMHPGQSALSSFALLFAIVALFVAKAWGFFEQPRRQHGGDNTEDVLAALSFF